MTFLVHYGELALKGDNKRMFEDALVSNIEKQLGEGHFSYVKRLWGRILIEGGDAEYIKNALSHVFGIANFSLTEVCKPNITDIKDSAWSLAQNRQFKSFKIDARRAEKTLPFTSQDINMQVGAYIQEKSGAKVVLKNPDLTVFVEVLHDKVFVYTEKYKGPGGLPLGSSAKVISLLSSGIDSPVATWKIMKRGAVPVSVHFHSYPQTSRESLKNTQQLLGVLNEWSAEPLALYAVPFLDIQKFIITNAPAKLGVILYRRSMVRIAEMVAKQEGAHALVTGESLGQVASQTVENIAAVDQAASLPILRPNIGDDKSEIIDLARKLGTYEISIRPYEDCCTLFVPEHPETRARVGEVKKIEGRLQPELQKLEKKALKEAQKNPAD